LDIKEMLSNIQIHKKREKKRLYEKQRKNVIDLIIERDFIYLHFFFPIITFYYCFGNISKGSFTVSLFFSHLLSITGFNKV